MSRSFFAVMWPESRAARSQRYDAEVACDMTTSPPMDRVRSWTQRATKVELLDPQWAGTLSAWTSRGLLEVREHQVCVCHIPLVAHRLEKRREVRQQRIVVLKLLPCVPASQDVINEPLNRATGRFEPQQNASFRCSMRRPSAAGATRGRAACNCCFHERILRRCSSAGSR